MKHIFVAAFTIKLYCSGNKKYSIQDALIAHVIIYVFLYITSCLFLIQKWIPKENVKNREVKVRYGYIFDEINAEANDLNKFYLTLFHIRKLVFIMIPVIFKTPFL
jgi:hypothetical protein